MATFMNHPEYAGRLGNLRAEYDAWRQANPSTYTYETYGRRAQFEAREIDWECFKAVRPVQYSRIAKQVEAMGVTWEQAVNDREIRITICKAAGYWY